MWLCHAPRGCVKVFQGHVSSSHGAIMVGGASPHIYSCHIINDTTSGHQAPSSSNPKV
jgi:hypothetical protein